MYAHHFTIGSTNAAKDVIERHPCRPLSKATAEEAHAVWYAITDKIAYLPGNMATKNTTYHACFHDLPSGLQTHIYAPLGLEIRGKWSVGGNLPGEPRVAAELGIGAPKDGLYLREDVDMRCNWMVTKFVKKNLRASHGKLVDRLIERSHIEEGRKYNERVSTGLTSPTSSYTPIVDSYMSNERSSIVPNLQYTPPNRTVSPSPAPSYQTSQQTYAGAYPARAVGPMELDGQNHHIPREAGGDYKAPVELPGSGLPPSSMG